MISHARQALSLLLTVCIIFVNTPAFTLPEGEQVVSGNAAFDRSDPNTLTINQASDQLIANYDSFSIGSAEAVRFLQPSSSSIALNRVTGSDPSNIFGILSANGIIYLINPNGILFGQGCRVDTAGLVASTLGISNEDFLAGRYAFSGNGAGIINRGNLSAPGGFIGLLGSSVQNEGLIQADLGTVYLASGSAMALNLDPQGLISVIVNEATIANPAASADAVSNKGVIQAEGGKVVLSAKTLNGIFDNAVNNEGVIEAQSVGDDMGEVFLLGAGEGMRAVNTGVIDVSGAGTSSGGFVEISGESVTVEGVIKADSEQGEAGTLLIDPLDLIIKNGSPSDGLGDASVGEKWLEAQNCNIILKADRDVISQLYTDNILSLGKFNTETFRIEAGRDIILNNDSIVTCGGAIQLLADQGTADGIGAVNLGIGAGLKTNGGSVLLDGANLLISAPVVTSGGNVELYSRSGDIVQTGMGDILTCGGNVKANSARDYVMKNQSDITSGSGTVDIFASRNILLGSAGTTIERYYAWEYKGGGRCGQLQEFGYYYDYEGNLVRVALVQGTDIGKDGVSALFGSGVLPDYVTDVDLYAMFKAGANLFSVYEDPYLNADGLDHVGQSGTEYGWDRAFESWSSDKADVDDPSGNSNWPYNPNDTRDHQGNAGNPDMLPPYGYDKDSGRTEGDRGRPGCSDAAIFDFTVSQKSFAEGSHIKSSGNVFLTADTGYIEQHAGSVKAYNLAIETNTGMKGTEEHNSFITGTTNLSAVNKTSGDIAIMNIGDAIIKDLSGLTGLNPGVTGFNGMTNFSCEGDIFLKLFLDPALTVAAPVRSYGGDITLIADHDIIQKDAGDIEIINGAGYGIPTPTIIFSNPLTGVWTNDNTVEVKWVIGESGSCAELGKYTGIAGGSYIMESGATVKTHGGDVNITAPTVIKVTGIDAAAGTVNLTSAEIRDNDLGTVGGTGAYPLQNDTDISAKRILLNAPVKGGCGPGEEIDIAPPYEFSLLFDTNSATEPDNVVDLYSSALDSAGNWVFSAVSAPLHDGDFWWFHVAALSGTNQGNTAHKGPFFIDTTAPVIRWNVVSGIEGLHGWYLSDVNVAFTATDNLSGFTPDGALTAAAGTGTTSGEGQGLLVTSDGICDRAGNAAVPVFTSFNVDKSAPIVTVGAPSGTEGLHGWWLSDVTVPFTATDTVSGFDAAGTETASLTASTSGEGRGLTVTSEGIFDYAGNRADPASFGPFNVDKTAPIIASGAPSGTAGLHDWWLSDVTVAFTATDAVSGFDAAGASTAGLGSKTTTGEGRGLTVTSGTVMDYAGNVASAVNAGPFNVDKTAPVITAGAPSGTSGLHGWWLSDVTVPFSATDAVSGFDAAGTSTSDLPSGVTAGEGRDLVVASGTIMDYAGNLASAVSAGPFNVDKTAPVITAGAPAGTPGLNGWWLSDVTVPFTAADAVSGFDAAGTGSAALAPKTTAGEGTALTVTSDGVYDYAGNFASGVNAGPFKSDQTAPVISAGAPTGTPGPGADTWLSDITVPFSATDNLSGFAPSGDLFTDMDPKTTSGFGPGLFVTSEGIFDAAGNFAPGIMSGPFQRIALDANYSESLRNLRVYYEIVNNYQFNSFEPATPTTFFAYHPITSVDSEAFERIALDINAYEFVEEQLKLKDDDDLPAYYGG